MSKYQPLYKALDGRLFDNVAEVEKYDKVLEQSAAITTYCMSELKIWARLRDTILKWETNREAWLAMNKQEIDKKKEEITKLRAKEAKDNPPKKRGRKVTPKTSPSTTENDLFGEKENFTLDGGDLDL